MSLFGRAFAQINPFDKGRTFANTAPKPRPKPQPKVNAQQLKQALAQHQINQQQFINQFAKTQNAPIHPQGFITRYSPANVGMSALGAGKAVSRGIVNSAIDTGKAPITGVKLGAAELTHNNKAIQKNTKDLTKQATNSFIGPLAQTAVLGGSVFAGKKILNNPNSSPELKQAQLRAVNQALNAQGYDLRDKGLRKGLKLGGLVAMDVATPVLTKGGTQLLASTSPKVGEAAIVAGKTSVKAGKAAAKIADTTAEQHPSVVALRGHGQQLQLGYDNANSARMKNVYSKAITDNNKAIRDEINKIKNGGYVRIKSGPTPEEPSLPQNTGIAGGKQPKIQGVQTFTNKIDRTQLSGKALSTPTSQLERQAGKAPAELAPQPGRQLPASADNLSQSQLQKTPVSNPSLPPSIQDTGDLFKQIDTEYRPVSVGEHIDQAVGHKTYDISKKVGIQDYIRTPEHVLNKMGIGGVAKDLQKAELNYKQTLPKEIDKISQWHKELGKSPEASQRVFQHLDGQKVTLNPTEAKVAGEMKAYLSQWADRLHLPKESRLSNYITHIFEDSLLKKEFDPELEKLIVDKTARSVYDPFTMQRLGAKGYKEDAIAALDAYVKRGTRKEAFDPALAKLEEASQNLDVSGQKFVKSYADRINMRPTHVDGLIDNLVKQGPVGYKLGQRPVARATRAIRQATFRATLGGNVGSAVRNLTQGINTFTELGGKYTGVGYSKTVQSLVSGSKELEDVGVLSNSLIEDRALSAAKKGLEKVDSGLFALFNFAEKMNRGAAYYGAKTKALKAGQTEQEAVQSGIDAARKTQFTFGKVDTPIALQSDIGKTLLQFQSFNVKQAEFLGGIIKKKEYAKMARFAGASAAVYFSLGKALGYKPQDMIPFGSNLFGGNAPIAQTPPFQAAMDVPKLVTKHSKKAAMKLGSDLGSASIPGFVQGKKTVTGIKAVNRAPADQQTTGAKVKAAIFGPSTFNAKQKALKKDAKTSQDNPTTQTITKDAFSTPKGKELIAQPNEGARKTWAGQSQENYDLYKQYKAMKTGLGASPVHPPGLSDAEKSTLNKFSRLTTVGANKVKQNDPKRYTDYQLATVKQQLLNGAISQETYDKKVASLTKPKVAKVKVGKVKKVRIGRGKGGSRGSRVSKASTVKIGKLPSGKFKLAKSRLSIKAKRSKPAKFKIAKLGAKPKKIKVA